MSENRIRLGFIGCGWMGREHLKAVEEAEDALVVATCDLDEKRAKQVADEYGAKSYADFRRMLDHEELDALFICLPGSAHGEPEIAAIDRGLSFFVEKPVALTMDTAKQILEKVKAAGLLTCVGYQLRYTESAQAAKRLLGRRTVGCVSGRYWCGTGRMQGWVTDFSHSGGQIVDQATHMIDMMRYLVGEIDEVFCYQAKRILTSGNCPDSNALALRFSNGVVGTLNATWAGDPDDWSQANILNIFFDNHRLEWKADAMEVTPPLESEVASASTPGSAQAPTLSNAPS